jgi:hypothetical protein
LFGEFFPQVGSHDGACRAGAEDEEIFHDFPFTGFPQARSQRPKMSGSLIT